MTKAEQKTLRDHHYLAIFALFCFAALLGVSTVLFHNATGDSLTGAFTTTANYNECTDYGNYIILQNDAGWRKVKKDICTGVDNKLIRKVACILPERDGYSSAETQYYIYTYTKVAFCDSGKNCALDENHAAYCPE